MGTKETIKVVDVITITKDVKGKSFFVDGINFLFITEEGQMNRLCLFDDDILKIAREYADKNAPELNLLSAMAFQKSPQEKYISKTRQDYWSHLFSLAIWNYLAKQNEVVYMQRP